MSLQITFVWSNKGYIVRCGCGYLTDPRYTLEGAGREMDNHINKINPLHSKKFPCPSQDHGFAFEYDPTPFLPGEGNIIPRLDERRAK